MISHIGTKPLGVLIADIEKRTVSRPAEHAASIDAKVAPGAFASASEVVRAGLRALQERDDAVERWLHQEVVATYDAMQAHPSRALPAKSVFDAIREDHAAKLKRSG